MTPNTNTKSSESVTLNLSENTNTGIVPVKEFLAGLPARQRLAMFRLKALWELFAGCGVPHCDSNAGGTALVLSVDQGKGKKAKELVLDLPFSPDLSEAQTNALFNNLLKAGVENFGVDGMPAYTDAFIKAAVPRMCEKRAIASYPVTRDMRVSDTSPNDWMLFTDDAYTPENMESLIANRAQRDELAFQFKGIEALLWETKRAKNGNPDLSNFAWLPVVLDLAKWFVHPDELPTAEVAAPAKEKKQKAPKAKKLVLPKMPQAISLKKLETSGLDAAAVDAMVSSGAWEMGVNGSTPSILPTVKGITQWKAQCDELQAQYDAQLVGEGTPKPDDAAQALIDEMSASHGK